MAHDVAAKWRVTRWFDVDIGDKEIVIWGSPIESSQQSILKQLRDYMIRSYFVPASNLDNSIINNMLKIIIKRQPKMLFGYPSIIFLIANYALRNKIKCSHLGIKVCFVTSEILDLTQKKIIQEVFNCIVVNGYGGRESGFIAHECPLGRMHITSEDINVEINPIKLETNSQLGEVLITHYESSDFPFIRYQTGDLAELDNKPCECGRNHPILKNIEGRKSDLIISSNGKVIHRSTISTLIHSFKEIEQYTLHQSSITHYQLNIVSENFENKVKQLRERLKYLLGNNSNINICQVGNISKSASGKRTYVTSDVKYELF